MLCAGLQQCRWAGRNQVVHRGGVAYYMDGAHTPESVEASAEWFLSETSGDDRSGSAPHWVCSAGCGLASLGVFYRLWASLTGCVLQAVG